MDLRERLGRATQSSDLGEHDGALEVDIDRVGALGLAAMRTAIGAAIVRWIAARQDSAYLDVVELLVVAMEARYGKADPDLVLRVTLQACREFSDWGCSTCAGRGELVSGTGVRYVCPTCDGTRLRRYRDHERADAMRVSLAEYHRRAERKLAWALDELHRHDHELQRASRSKLG